MSPPGQNAVTKAGVCSVKSVTRSVRTSAEGTNAGDGMIRPLPLVLKRSATAFRLKASAPMPYAVSVGQYHQGASPHRRGGFS